MTRTLSTPPGKQDTGRPTVDSSQVLIDIPVDFPHDSGSTASFSQVALGGGRRGRDAGWWTGVWAAFLARYSSGKQVTLAGPDGWHTIEAPGSEPMSQLLDRTRQVLGSTSAVSAADTAGPAAGSDAVRGVSASIACADGTPPDACDIGLRLEGDQVQLRGDSRLWAPDTLRRMARHLDTVAAQVAADAGRRVEELELLDEQERRRIIHEWNDTDISWPAGEYLDLIAEQARAHPDTPAVAHGRRSIDFAEFEALTNRLAHRLRRANVCDGDRVGLFCPRGADYVLGAIAILKAGAAIVALDPVNPDQRIGYMLADSDPQAVLTTGSLRDRLPDGWTVLGIDSSDSSDSSQDEPSSPVRSSIGSQGISHLIYTSGSTGEPKAVLERRAAIENLVHWTRRAYGVRPGDRASWLSTPGFAVQIMEWMPYLALGVTICIPEAAEAQSPERIRDWLVAEGVTHTMLVAALAEPAWSLDWPSDTALRVMVTTAERVHSWPPVDTPFRVVMTYGTTETTNALTCLDIGAGIDLTSAATPERIRANRPVPVGRPIANVRAYILDASDRPVPPGVVGRLLIEGAGLSAGYHNRAELTAAKFHSGVIGGTDGLVYETGDLARYRADGAIELLGRNDAQVKVRGFRVELGEVESAIAANPAVREVVVTAHHPTPEDVWLVAYLTTADSHDDVSGLKAELAKVLPFYMVPTVVVRLDEIPRLPNGKTDLRALPDPGAALRESQGADYVAPVTEVEVQMTRLWTSLFHGRQIGTEDNFFELGGHSLLAFRMLDGIRQAFDIELSTTDLYAHPTAGELAALVSAGQSGSAQFADLPPIVVDPAARFEPFPLTDSQQAMWIGRGGLVELGGVGCHGYFEWQSDDLDVDRFDWAWRQLMERHDALRTRVLPDGTQQVLREIPEYEIPRLDLRACSEEVAEQRLRELRDELAHTVLPAESWPLFDVRLSLLPGTPQTRPVRIHLALDFLIADAWSYFEVLLPDLVAIYEGRQAMLEPLELTFRDYVIGVGRSLPDSELYRRSRWYWVDRLGSLPPAPRLPERPADQPALPVRFDRRSARVSAEDWQSIRSLATEFGATPSGVLAAAYAEVLQAWSSEPSFCVNFPLFNRLPLHPQVTKLIGDTTTTLLLAVEGSGATFAERAQALQKQLWTDLEHRYFSGVQVLRELTKARGRLVPAMPIVMTSLVGYPPAAEHTALGSAIYAISQTPQVSLDFQVFESEGGLRYNWDFVAAVFPDGVIEEMFDAFRALLARLTTPEGWRRASLGSGPYSERSRTTVRSSEVDANDVRVGEAWERYWATINSTGRGGDVLWDADSDEEMQWCLQQAARYMDPSLPVVDLGCGNGRYSRVLAGQFGEVIGIDVSASAIEHARAESDGIANLRFAVLDGSSEDALSKLSAELGPVNVFVRGVLHVLGDEARTGVAATVAALIGDRGVALLMEPSYAEGSFGYVGFVGGAKGRAAELVRPLEAAGVRHSTRFGPDELARFFPPASWAHLTVESVTMRAVDPESDSDTLRLPGFYAAVSRQRALVRPPSPPV